MASSVTRYHAELSPCTISEKSNDPILRKLSDRRTNKETDGQRDRDRETERQRETDRQTDRQTDNSEFIGRCLTNVKQKINKRIILRIKNS